MEAQRGADKSVTNGKGLSLLYVSERQGGYRKIVRTNKISIVMEYLSDGWREDIEDAIEDANGIMLSEYGAGIREGLRQALKIIENHI